jgi:hypothetical protein
VLERSTGWGRNTRLRKCAESCGHTIDRPGFIAQLIDEGALGLEPLRRFWRQADVDVTRSFSDDDEIIKA